MLCPCCGWTAKEVEVEKQRYAYTCNNGVCNMCYVVFEVHVMGHLTDTDCVLSKDEKPGKGC